MKDDEWKEFLRSLKFFAVMFGTGLVDCIFLGLWVIVQWFVGTHIMPLFPLTDDTDKTTLSLFQKLFAISTLAPIVLYICADIIIMGIKMTNKVLQAIEALKKKGLHKK